MMHVQTRSSYFFDNYFLVCARTVGKKVQLLKKKNPKHLFLQMNFASVISAIWTKVKGRQARQS